MCSQHRYAMNEAGQQELLETALAAARDTRCLTVGRGSRHQTAAVFERLFGGERAVIVADENTFAAAGRDVQDSFAGAGHAAEAPFVFGRDVHAGYSFVDE